MTQDRLIHNLYLYPVFQSKGRGEPVEASYFGIDVQNMNLPKEIHEQMQPLVVKALLEMNDLEKGAIANQDENRMVGHYWLRDSMLAPSEVIQQKIEKNIQKIIDFTQKVHQGTIQANHARFRQLIVIGIGGSALGPQMVAHALSQPDDPMIPFFLDNTDPDGIQRVLTKVERTGNEGSSGFAQTLVLVISKSGGTKETRNGMLEVKAAFEKQGLLFAQHAVAITMEGSELYQVAIQEKWLEVFPMWDFIGGRTSELSAVGLLPAALQGINIQEMLQGAKEMDVLTRKEEVIQNPALLLAMSWYHAVKQGGRDMVVLPYKDRLELFPRYLQQLVMESIGKEKDRNGKIVKEGIVVYGNKGSTDQHAYVQQLREGLDHFFVTFIEVLQDKYSTPSPVIIDESSTLKAKVLNQRESSQDAFFVEEDIQSGDYLTGFLLGTREALYEKGRLNLTLILPEVSAYTIGMLIALYERAVGYYASFVDVNAYHQPGVEAGKKAATIVLQLQRTLLSRLNQSPQTILELCHDMPLQIRDAFYMLEHLAYNGRIGRKATEILDASQIQYFSW